MSIFDVNFNFLNSLFELASACICHFVLTRRFVSVNVTHLIHQITRTLSLTHHNNSWVLGNSVVFTILPDHQEAHLLFSHRLPLQPGGHWHSPLTLLHTPPCWQPQTWAHWKPKYASPHSEIIEHILKKWRSYANFHSLL